MDPNQVIEKAGILSISLLLFTTSLIKQAWSDSQKWSDETLPTSKIHLIWSEGQKVDTGAMASSLGQSISVIQKNPWFLGRLPDSWGIFIDADWTLSSGFFSDALKTPQGFSAVLFSPVALLDQDHETSLLTHELTHLMHQRLRPQEESWVREGIAMMGEWKVTGFYNPALEEAFALPESSLTAPLDPREAGYADGGLRTAEYGQILQYFMYIYRLCGKDSLLEKLLTSKLPESGAAFMDAILRAQNASSPACQGFEASFRAFSLARFEQSVLNPENFVVLAPYRSIVREKPLPLPAYSSSAYMRPAGQPCRADDSSWGATRCIEIRLK
jgi:hypothetical protein